MSRSWTSGFSLFVPEAVCMFVILKSKRNAKIENDVKTLLQEIG